MVLLSVYAHLGEMAMAPGERGRGKDADERRSAGYSGAGYSGAGYSDADKERGEFNAEAQRRRGAEAQRGREGERERGREGTLQGVWA